MDPSSSGASQQLAQSTQSDTNNTTPPAPEIRESQRDAALRLHDWGWNVLPIEKGTAKPKKEWKHWQTQRQKREEVEEFAFGSQGGIGVINGWSGIRCLDIDCIKIYKTDADGEKLDVDGNRARDTQKPAAVKERISVPDDILSGLLSALGLPADYPWAWRSRNKAGWHIWVISGDQGDPMPAAIQEWSGGKGGVVAVGAVDAYVNNFDHIELRWGPCYTIIPSLRTNGHIPHTLPERVSSDKLLAALQSIAAPKVIERVTPSQSPVRGYDITTHQHSARNGRSLDIAATKALLEERLNVLSYFESEFGKAREINDPNWKWDLPQSGGLFVAADEKGWHCFSSGAGGQGYVTAVAYVERGNVVPKGKAYIDFLIHCCEIAKVEPVWEKTPIQHKNWNGMGGMYEQAIQMEDDDRYKNALFRFKENTGYTADDVQMAIGNVDWVVEGILARQQLSLLFAKPGVGKSLVALDMALSVAQTYPVVYVAAEAPAELVPRIEAWKNYYAAPEGKMIFITEKVDLSDHAESRAFIEHCCDCSQQQYGEKPALVVIDPFFECFGDQDENDSKGMRRITQQIKEMARFSGASMLIVHHTGWADDHERGSSSLRGAVRVAMKLSRDSNLLLLQSEKANNGVVFDTKLFRIEIDTNGRAVAVRGCYNDRIDDTTLTQNDLDILRLVKTSTRPELGVTHGEVVEETGKPKSTCSKILKKLVRHGFMHMDDRKKYFITTEGATELTVADQKTVIGGTRDLTTHAQQNRFSWTTVKKDDDNAVVHSSLTACSPHVHSEFTPSSLRVHSTKNDEYAAVMRDEQKTQHKDVVISSLPHSAAGVKNNGHAVSGVHSSSLGVHSEFTPSSPLVHSDSQEKSFTARTDSSLVHPHGVSIDTPGVNCELSVVGEQKQQSVGYETMMTWHKKWNTLYSDPCPVRIDDLSPAEEDSIKCLQRATEIRNIIASKQGGV